MMTQEGRGRPALLQAALDSLRVPDLRNKIIFTFAMLAIYRLVAQVPLPGVDRDPSTTSSTASNSSDFWTSSAAELCET